MPPSPPREARTGGKVPEDTSAHPRLPPRTPRTCYGRSPTEPPGPTQGLLEVFPARAFVVLKSRLLRALVPMHS